MKCRHFENDVADWVAGTLPLDLARQMAAHRSECASCAQIASDEETLRLRWSVWKDAPPTPDLRQRVVARLAGDAPRQGIRFGYRWATAALAAVIVPIAIVVSQGIHPSNIGPGPSANNLPRIAAPSQNPDFGNALPQGLVADAAGGDQSVDDPVGAGMEHVIWTSASTNSDSQ